MFWPSVCDDTAVLLVFLGTALAALVLRVLTLTSVVFFSVRFNFWCNGTWPVAELGVVGEFDVEDMVDPNDQLISMKVGEEIQQDYRGEGRRDMSFRFALSSIS